MTPFLFIVIAYTDNKKNDLKTEFSFRVHEKLSIIKGQTNSSLL